MRRYSIEPITRKCIKGYGYLPFTRKNNYWIQDCKNCFQNVIHKGGESFGNIIAGTVTKLNDDKIVEQEPAEEIIIPLEKRGEILDKLRKVL